MTPDVRDWFERAIDVATRDRQTFLEANCGDQEVREEVASLLRYDGGPSSAELPATVRRAVGAVLGTGEPGAPASRVGRFQVGRLLGFGGMGSVYEGWRVDGEVRQRVAIKFAQALPGCTGTWNDKVRRRFARERQMLASLQHPYIAGLIDAGATEDGVPYAVIEQVDGVPIDTYCDRHVPGWNDRIALVLRLCEAVQFAHRNLVVHSDIKPDNVLVTAEGFPKLIDFGAANDLAEDDPQAAVHAFTPSYASPEQCLGRPITVATDVYGIGAVLYRLLTGVSPRQLQGVSLDQAVRRIGEEDVPQPSTIRRELKGDLENILRKALHRHPEQRYGSVPELVDDLHRYLSFRPVRATPQSTLYRAGRFVRRNRIPLAATVAFTGGMLIAAVVSVRERQEAQTRLVESRQLADRLLFEVHDEIGGALGGTRARVKLGEIAVQYLENADRKQAGDPEIAWELLNAYARLAQSRGGTSSSLGDTGNALTIARKVMALGRTVENSPRAGDRAERLFTIYESMAGIFLEAGSPQEQRELIDRLLRLTPRLGRVQEAKALKHLARFFDAAGEPQKAAEAWARALAVLRAVSPEPAQAAAELISTLVGYGRALALSGDFDNAVSSIQEAIRIAESRSGSDPQTARSMRQMYWAHIALGDILGSPFRFSQRRWTDAVEEYRKAEAIAADLVKADGANDVAKLDRARALSREGAALSGSEPALALAALQRACDGNPETGARFAYLVDSVAPLVQLGQLDRAGAQLAEARRLVKELHDQPSSPHLQELLKAESTLAFAAGRQREAIRLSQEHLSLLPQETRRMLSENFPTVEVLERLRAYADGLDTEVCAMASDRLSRIWADLRAAYPTSPVVRAEAARAAALLRSGCTPASL